MTTVWILGDQLTPTISSLADLRPAECVVLLIESVERARLVRYHKHKLVLVWSAMRHFAEEMRGLGYTVDYHASRPDFASALREHAARFRPDRLRLMEASEWGVTERLQNLAERETGARVEITPSSQFICAHDAFLRLVGRRRHIVMEEFYRHLRRKTGLLMDGDTPAGGQFNYDVSNRERPPKGHVFPAVPTFAPDAITQEVMRFVGETFPSNFGDLDNFWWPVTRREAEQVRADFFANRLDLFGPYEDALVSGERALYHSALSALMNVGLLDPLESCRAAEEHFRDGRARLNSVEGYVRQILGWREFIHQFYLWKMPGLKEANHFGHDLPLPAFYTDPHATDMFCLRESVASLERWGTTHHIQRLMVLGNFALIAGIEPRAIHDWFWLAYADAYDWVVTPNVLGISQYADGGTMNGGIATKPYAAGANYINTMSDYCKRCVYNPKKAVGDDACPFNALFWDFLARNEHEFRQNPRMEKVLLSLGRRTPDEQNAIHVRASDIKRRLRCGERV